MPYFGAPPKAPSKLGRYRVLSPTAGLRVSPLQLGAMNIGDKWNAGMGAMDKESSFKLLDAYFDAGGNFIDTASKYQEETSEIFIGEWVEARGIRDQLVIATKYTAHYKKVDPAITVQANYVGNSVKSMHVSVEASLRKLRTSYIDIFYVHWWDFATSVEEVMNGLHNLVTQGKVLYLGISDSPAWVVAKANQYARDHGKTPFVIYQGMWSVLDRSFERDIIPMCRSEGLALAPWGALGAGKIRTDEEEERRRESGENGRMMINPQWERTEDEKKMCKALEQVAKEVGAEHITAVALAYLLQKTPYVFPIVGGRKVEHLHANISALDIVLSDAHIKFIQDVLPFDVGFPNRLIGDGTYDNAMLVDVAEFDRQPMLPPIRPSKN